MNFFQTITQLGAQDVDMKIKTSSDGVVTVMISVKTTSTDSALKSMIPLVIKGIPSEVDEKFFSEISTPVKNTQEFYSNVEAFEAQKKEAEKSAAKEKADKAAESKTKKEAPKKETPDPLDVLLASLKTDNDWLKNKDKITELTEMLLKNNPKNEKAIKAKADLASKEKVIPGSLFADGFDDSSIFGEPAPVVEKQPEPKAEEPKLILEEEIAVAEVPAPPVPPAPNAPAPYHHEMEEDAYREEEQE